MSYSVFAVANPFIELAKTDGITDLTNMKLQKLVYISQGFTLAVQKRVLFKEAIHAFEWGPVIPILYNAVKRYGKKPITEPITLREGTRQIDLESEDIENQIINTVWKKYRKFSAAQLSTITHKPGTPWANTWDVEPYGVISTDEIFLHYRNLLEE